MELPVLPAVVLFLAVCQQESSGPQAHPPWSHSRLCLGLHQGMAPTRSNILSGTYHVRSHNTDRLAMLAQAESEQLNVVLSAQTMLLHADQSALTFTACGTNRLNAAIPRIYHECCHLQTITSTAHAGAKGKQQTVLKYTG